MRASDMEAFAGTRGAYDAVVEFVEDGNTASVRAPAHGVGRVGAFTWKVTG